MQAVATPAKTRTVNVKKGSKVELRIGRGAGALVVEFEHFASGSVELRNASTGAILRQWTGKEARNA